MSSTPADLAFSLREMFPQWSLDDVRDVLRRTENDVELALEHLARKPVPDSVLAQCLSQAAHRSATPDEIALQVGAVQPLYPAPLYDDMFATHQGTKEGDNEPLLSQR